jgi:hypothetical protein
MLSRVVEIAADPLQVWIIRNDRKDYEIGVNTQRCLPEPSSTLNMSTRFEELSQFAVLR